LLSDVLALRDTILTIVDAATLEALGRRAEVYIAIVAAGGYEYTVAMLAVLALGAAAVPITPALPVEEAAYFVEKSRAALVLVSSFDLKKCCDLEKRIASTSNEHFRGVSLFDTNFHRRDADVVIHSRSQSDRVRSHQLSIRLTSPSLLTAHWKKMDLVLSSSQVVPRGHPKAR
jgi:long-subunit acyl-CoA synthetase (AMP-forming)